jgi:probable F420-dependent oxidoreductase
VKIGAVVRTMGPVATREIILECARAAESAGLDAVWLPDHLAIPPDDAEGSEGRYLDVLATLAFLAAATSRIGLGSGVLILPYRPTLPSAKWIATIQELSDQRLRLGVGAGWMRPEFQVLGIPRSQRGRLTDETLDFLHRCFASDEVEANGQRFLFRPRPKRPPIYVGGAPPHALERAVRFGEGWIPLGAPDPDHLAPHVARLRELAAKAGRPEPEVVLMTALPLDDLGAARDRVQALAAAGVTGIVHGSRYADAAGFCGWLDALGALQ